MGLRAPLTACKSKYFGDRYYRSRGGAGRKGLTGIDWEAENMVLRGDATKKRPDGSPIYHLSPRAGCKSGEDGW